MCVSVVVCVVLGGGLLVVGIRWAEWGRHVHPSLSPSIGHQHPHTQPLPPSLPPSPPHPPTPTPTPNPSLPTQDTNMSFAVSMDGGAVEWCSDSVQTLKGAVYARMVRDMLRFNASAGALLQVRRLRDGMGR